jgi:hypothetical protein
LNDRCYCYGDEIGRRTSVPQLIFECPWQKDGNFVQVVK